MEQSGTEVARMEILALIIAGIAVVVPIGLHISGEM
jgi:hypothetical protein